MDDRPPNPNIMIPGLRIEKDDDPNETKHEFSIYRRNGQGQYTKMTITLSAVCLIVGGLVRGVWDVSEYSHSQLDSIARINTLEGNGKVEQATIENMQRQLTAENDRSTDLRARMASLETALSQANNLLQKLSESNARLEERVIFLVAQVEGRMSAPTAKGRKP